MKQSESCILGNAGGSEVAATALRQKKSFGKLVGIASVIA
jgi:hypothetical protein